MTAYEMVDGIYYTQGSEAHILALEAPKEEPNSHEYPTVPTEQLIAWHFWPVRKVLNRAVVLAGLRR